MAIIIEEEKKRTNWVFIFSVLIIVIGVGSTVFYLFFVNPSQVEVFISPRLQSLNDFEKINFQPNDLVENVGFKSLKTQINFVSADQGAIGKVNPFLP